MPAKTHAAALPVATKRFSFFDVKRFLLLFRMSLKCSAAAAITGVIVPFASIDDHRERL